ncbi:hypothetical protein [Aeromonas media]|uniref:hypothetical protein n=1 Tax=Aeromonas media TaxID=651 RepID=UPI0015F93DE0|nr:hypothetical protein [Aeromonas media]
MKIKPFMAIIAILTSFGASSNTLKFSDKEKAEIKAYINQGSLACEPVGEHIAALKKEKLIYVGFVGNAPFNSNWTHECEMKVGRIYFRGFVNNNTRKYSVTDMNRSEQLKGYYNR